MNTPSFPKVKSLEAIALAYVLTGHRISHLSFQGDTRSYCLRAPICNLRRWQWPIDDCWNAGSVSKISGRKTRFKKYFITDENLNALRLLFGERLGHFVDSVQLSRLEGKEA